jgi:hypothetical protein
LNEVRYVHGEEAECVGENNPFRGAVVNGSHVDETLTQAGVHAGHLPGHAQGRVENRSGVCGVKAVLHTRCGCTKTIDANRPERSFYKAPICLAFPKDKQPPPLDLDLNADVTYIRRCFEFERIVEDYDGPVAHYLEVL